MNNEVNDVQNSTRIEKKTPCVILKSAVHNFENFSHKPTIPS